MNKASVNSSPGKKAIIIDRPPSRDSQPTNYNLTNSINLNANPFSEKNIKLPKEQNEKRNEADLVSKYNPQNKKLIDKLKKQETPNENPKLQQSVNNYPMNDNANMNNTGVPRYSSGVLWGGYSEETQMYFTSFKVKYNQSLQQFQLLKTYDHLNLASFKITQSPTLKGKNKEPNFLVEITNQELFNLKNGTKKVFSKTPSLMFEIAPDGKSVSRFEIFK